MAKIFRYILIGTIALFVLICLGSAIPDAHWTFAVLPHFRVQYLLSALILALCALLLSKRARAIALPALALCAIYHTTVIFPLGECGIAPPGFSTFRVVLWNVWRRSANQHEIIDLIRQQSPDIAILQEADAQLLSIIDESFPEYTSRIAGDSLFMVNESETLSLTHFTEQAIGSTTGGQLTFHWNTNEISLLGVHLSAPISKAMIASRAEQFEAIATWTSTQKNPALVIGDLNTTPWSPEFQTLENTLKNSMDGFGIQPTWPFYNAISPILKIPIDHALHTHEIVTVNRRALDARSSNHRPVVFDFSL